LPLRASLCLVMLQAEQAVKVPMCDQVVQVVESVLWVPPAWMRMG
jgi:hypothetical protein